MTAIKPLPLAPIWILTFGSLGDVLPLAALGSELTRRGHAVTLWCGSLHVPMVQQMGMEVVPIVTDDLPSLRLHANTLHKAPSLWQRVEQAMQHNLADIADRFTSLTPQSTRPIVVASTFALAGRIAQEKFGLRLVTVHLSPMCMASFLDMPVIRGLNIAKWIPRAIRPIFGRTLERLLFDPVTARAVNSLRRQLDLLPVRNIFSQWVHSPDLVLGLFPSWFGVPQSDWPLNTRVLDFPMADGAGIRCLSDADPGLEEFLAAGAAPVVFYPGSAKRDTREFFDHALHTCQQLGLRCILLTRYRVNVAGGDDLPPWALYRSYAPLGNVLPRAAAMVHCGGVGTLAQAVAAGCPQLVLPHHYDQFDNARRLLRLHLAISHRGPQWGQALQRLLHDGEVAKACRERRDAQGSRGSAISTAADLVQNLPSYKKA